MRYVFDLETDGLLPDLTKIHCLVIADADGEDVWRYTDDDPQYAPIQTGLDRLREADAIMGHNIIPFDIPAIQKVYPEWAPEGRVIDTLVMVRNRWAHVKEGDYSRARAGKLPGELIGSQSLKAWGHRLGYHKDSFGETTDWAEYSQEMLDYCEVDVLLNKRLIEYARKVGGFSQEALDTDHAVCWYLAAQERNGWPFDFRGAIRLQGTLSNRREELGAKLREQFGTWVEGGQEFTPKRDHSGHGYVAGCPMTKLKYQEFNPASRDHIANRLQTVYGWQPTEFTPTGKPKVSEDVLAALNIPGTEDLVEYLTVDKRLGQLAEGDQAWLSKFEHHPDTKLPHIHHSAQNVTITHRHRHSHPNVAQVPSSGAPYGKECRALWTVPEGWVLLGSDAAGLELRCLAHYMAKWDEGAYGDIILKGSKDDGTDIHTQNQVAAGLETRDQAKTFIYAYLYGAGDAKLGSIVSPHASEGTQRNLGRGLRKQFETKIPALGKLSKAVKQQAKKNTYLTLVDGRRAYVRHPHAALNTLLQGTGSVACKKWIAIFSERLEERFGPQGWHGQWAAVAWVHDEVQIAVRQEVAEEAAAIVTDALREAGEQLGFRIPLEADYALGRDWSETH